jgi:putative membrane protein
MSILLKKFSLAAAITAAALFAGMPVSGWSAEEPAASVTMTKVDKATFVSTAAAAGKFEIDSSKLALDKATSKEVKKFARQMIKDHTKAARQLTNIVKKEGDTPPADTLAPKDAEAMKQLEAATGADFDKAYVSIQEKAHMEAVALFKNYSANPDDKRLGRFAKKTLPTLEMHLEHVKQLSASQ